MHPTTDGRAKDASTEGVPLCRDGSMNKPPTQFPKKRIPQGWTASMICMACLSCTLSRAQPKPELPPEIFDTITVTASKRDARLQDMPLHTTVLGAEDLQKSSASTLDQLLKNLPGLNFTSLPSAQTDPTGQSTKMRGLGNAKVLLLLDGVPVMDPFYLTTQWFKLPLSNIERVEVVRGGNSSLWGNMAVAGVINVVSKRVKDDAGEWGLSVGSRGMSEVSLSQNIKVSDVLGFHVFVEHMNATGYPMTASDQAWRFPQKGSIDAKDSNLQLTSFYTPSADLKAYARVGVHIQDQAISYNWGRNLQKSPDLSLSMTKTLDTQTSLSIQGWHQSVDFSKYNGASCYWQSASSTPCPSFASLNSSQVNNTVVQYYTQHGLQNYSENGVSALLAKRFTNDWKDLQLGVDLRQLKADDREAFYAAPLSLSALQNPSSTTTGVGQQTFAGLFVQTRVSPVDPLPDLELTLSARYDSYSNTQREITRTTPSGPSTGGKPADGLKSAINPSLAARYSVNEHFNLRAASYKSFRAPGFNNTLRTFGSPNPSIANPDLSPETLWGKEIGMDYVKEGLSLSATYFVYDIKNMIATSNYQYLGANNPNNSPFVPSLVQTLCAGPTLSACAGRASFYSNAQDGQSQGFEWSAKWTWRPGLQWDASLTRTSSVLTQNQASTAPLGVQIAGLPWNTAHLGLDWQITPTTKVYLQAHYIGKMPIDVTSTLGQVYEQGGVSTFHASVKHQVNRDTDLSAYISNVFNRVYSENAYAFNQPWSATLSEPQTVHVSLRRRFS